MLQLIGGRVNQKKRVKRGRRSRLLISLSLPSILTGCSQDDTDLAAEAVLARTISSGAMVMNLG